ncbi:MAG TPA: solute carrier family 23 protein [Terrimicrobiaceae bacterium]
MPERPKDLIYALDERPPPFQLLALGFQHVAVICPYLVMVALVAAAAKLPHETARNAMAFAMIAVGFLTVLQSLRLGKVGSGYLCPPVVSAIYLPSSIKAAALFGFPVVCGMVVFAGLCEAGMAQLVNKMRKLFPAVVSGVVICAVGIELGKIGVGALAEATLANEVRGERMLVTSLGVLVTMTILAVWAKGLPKLLCALIGILVGYVLSAWLGMFPEDFLGQLSASPIFAVPDPRFISLSFEPSLMVPFAIAGLASGLRVVGVLTTCQQMNDVSWRRPDMKNIEAGVMADGIGCAVGGVLGAPGMSASPSLVGIEKTTAATSRVIAWSIAGGLVLLACLPKFASLIVSMPRPVMAAALFFNGSLMFVAGIQIIASRPITLRASLVVGFSILLALSVMVFPDFYRSLPAWTHQFTSSEITAAVISAVVLNAIFLLGTWRYSNLRLGDQGSPLTVGTFDDFLTRQAKEWKIPTEDVKRVLSVVDEAIEHVSANAQGPVEIRVGSDSFDVKVVLKYTGNLPNLPDARPKKEMVEEQSFVSGLTGYLSGLHADRVERSAKGEECEIRLLFRL